MTTTPLTDDELKRLNGRFESSDPVEIIRWAVETFRPSVALTASFGARSAGIIHMALQVDPKIEIRVVDTGLLFPETYEFMKTLQQRFHLNLKVFKTTLDVPKFLKEHEGQAAGHPDFCCSPYKVEATERMLKDVRCWITGMESSPAIWMTHARVTPERIDAPTGGVCSLPLCTRNTFWPLPSLT